MNAREEARRKADVMLAFAEGMEIECRYNGDSDDSWERIVFPTWDWSAFDYRIAQPKKRKVEKWQWVLEFKDKRQQWLTARFYADIPKEDADNLDCIVIQRADWTRIEVEE